MNREGLSIGETEAGAFELGSVPQERERVRAELEAMEREIESPMLRPNQVKELKDKIVLARQQLKMLDPNTTPEQLDPTIH